MKLALSSIVLAGSLVPAAPYQLEALMKCTRKEMVCPSLNQVLMGTREPYPPVRVGLEQRNLKYADGFISEATDPSSIKCKNTRVPSKPNERLRWHELDQIEATNRLMHIDMVMPTTQLDGLGPITDKRAAVKALVNIGPDDTILDFVSIEGGHISNSTVVKEEGVIELALDFQTSYSNIWPQGTCLYQNGDGIKFDSTGTFDTFLNALDASYWTYNDGDQPYIDPAYPTSNESGHTGPLQGGDAPISNGFLLPYGQIEGALLRFCQQR